MKRTNSDTLDLNLDNYTLDDIYALFKIRTVNEQTLKSAKQIVLKMHPDKSRLDSKYFLFFSKAYKRLHYVYEFQNSSNQTSTEYDATINNEHNALLKTKMMTMNNNPEAINKWFNEVFDKYRIENPNEQGHGDWLKSNEGYINVECGKHNMNEAIDKKKREMQSLTVYTGVTDMYSSTLGGSLLDGSDAGSSYYSDLKEAYTNTLIPVTEDVFLTTPKYKNVNEYKIHRDNLDITPLDKETAERKLISKQEKEQQYSATVAFKYAKQQEKVKQQNVGFWGELKQITGI